VQANQTRGTSLDLVLFRHLVQDLIMASRANRHQWLTKVVDHIRSSRYPLDCINHLLAECVTAGGTDGLDIAIDVLTQVGRQAVSAAEAFAKTDLGFRRNDATAPASHSVHDDVWYALLRGICRSDAAWPQKFFVLRQAANHKSESVREAVVHAMVDFVEKEPAMVDVTRSWLKQFAESDSSAGVKETAAEALRDLEA